MDQQEKSFLAAEFALGLLEDREQREVELLIAEDPEMRDRLHFWQRQFIGLRNGTPQESSAEVQEYLELFPAEETRGDSPWFGWLWDEIMAPENRGLVAAAVALKVGAITWVLWLI